MKKTALISIIATFALAKSITLMPFGAYLNYGGNTQKDYGYAGGLYLSYYDVIPKYNSGMKWELNLEDDYIHYSGVTKDYRSLVTTVIANWYYGYNWAFKAGVNHQKINNSGSSEHSNVYIGGINYYKYLKYNVGLDYYKTLYNKPTETLNINQITPYFGFNFGNYYSKMGSFYAEMKLSYIFSNKYLATKKHYTTAEFYLTNYKGRFTTTLKASIGKNAYKVENGGFVFYNTGDEYKNSFGIDVAYALNKTSSLKLSYSHATFTDIGNAHSDSIMLSYTKGFYY
ncbi:hypothetical protein [Caminibacter sp.]